MPGRVHTDCLRCRYIPAAAFRSPPFMPAHRTTLLSPFFAAQHHAAFARCPFPCPSSRPVRTDTCTLAAVSVRCQLTDESVFLFPFTVSPGIPPLCPGCCGVE